jgi:hypothetical protein
MDRFIGNGRTIAIEEIQHDIDFEDYIDKLPRKTV